MNKEEIIDSLIEILQVRHFAIMTAALDAKDAATNEESKAENKYDTRGLEASYLAGAQALRASEIKENIVVLSKIKLNLNREGTAVQLTSVVKSVIDGEDEKNFILLPVAGGTEVSSSEESIYVVTPESPIGKKLLGKTPGDSFEIKKKGIPVEYEILSVN